MILLDPVDGPDYDEVIIPGKALNFSVPALITGSGAFVFKFRLNICIIFLLLLPLIQVLELSLVLLLPLRIFRRWPMIHTPKALNT
jgi:hypothetical protein